MLDTFYEWLPWLIELLNAIAAIVLASTALTALTPTQLDNRAQELSIKWINVLLRILNTLAGNIAKNKNADDKPY